jgi:hypothetical protein
MRSDRALAWAVRVLWAVLPLVAGPPLAAALAGASRPVQVVASVGLWAGWAVGLLAALAPRPVGLTGLRVLAPAGAAAAVAAAAGGHRSVPALVLTLALAAGVVSSEVAAVFANGAAYPNERRFPLRAPAPLLVGPVPLAWAVIVVGIAAGPLLLAARQWLAGAVAVAVGLPAAGFLVRALHGLSRRWAVLVPAGLVLHDPMTLADPVLFKRATVEALRPAPAGTDSLDLTQRAPGLALELLLAEKVPMALVRPGRPEEAGASARLLFTPARPGALLAAARARRIPTG